VAGVGVGLLVFRRTCHNKTPRTHQHENQH
jgi:hypothetical protein